MLVVEVIIGHLQLEALLNLIRCLLEGDVHDAKVRLELEAELLELSLDAVDLFRRWDTEWTIGVEGTATLKSPSLVSLPCSSSSKFSAILVFWRMMHSVV